MEDENYTLEGVDDNAYAVIAYVRKAMRECGSSKEEIAKYEEDAKSSTYSNLLKVSLEHLAKLNNKNL